MHTSPQAQPLAACTLVHQAAVAGLGGADNMLARRWKTRVAPLGEPYIYMRLPPGLDRVGGHTADT
jgi:hypothetical protein